MTTVKIDLNCDMGEGCPNDGELMDYVSSVSIACGVHAGDHATMRKTVETALEKDVAIGAHPSFPDREGFGRRPMSLEPNEIMDIVSVQITELHEMCTAAGGRLRHVKPHGALYNQASRDLKTADAIARAVRAVDDRLVLFGLSGSLSITAAAQCGLATASEVFADRTYRPDGSLTPRNEPGALIAETDTALYQVLQMIRTRTVTATDGSTMPIVADTVCIHGDGQNALDFARSINRHLLEQGIEIVPVTRVKAV